MIILKDECKKRGLTVGEFLKDCPVPAQTIRDQCKSKPEVVLYLLRVLEQAKQIESLLIDVDRFESCKIGLANVEKHNEYLTEKVRSLKKKEI